VTVYGGDVERPRGFNTDVVEQMSNGEAPSQPGFIAVSKFEDGVNTGRSRVRYGGSEGNNEDALSLWRWVRARAPHGTTKRTWIYNFEHGRWIQEEG